MGSSATFAGRLLMTVILLSATASTAPQRSLPVLELESWETIDYPGASATYPYAINDAGVIAGTAQAAGGSTGFVRFRDSAFSLPIVDPNDTEHLTSVYGINNHQTIVGDSLASDSALSRVRSFLLRKDSFIAYDHPGVPFTTLTGINGRGDLAGITNDGHNHFHAFVDVGGVVTDFEPAGALVEVGAINNRGQVVGTFMDIGGVRGFLRDASGRLSAIDAPDGDFTTARAINNAGVIAGFFANLSEPTRRHGYLLEHGVFSTVDVPGAAATTILGINDARQVVGYYILPAEPSRVHGFVATVRNALSGRP